MSHVLIVEDERRIADLLQKGLQRHGFTTEVTGDGETALTRAASGECDLVLLDLGLPRLDGMSVLTALRGRGSQVPVIILTARHSVGATVAGLECGADDYLAKPFSFEVLLARVRARLRQSGSEESGVLEVGAVRLDLRTRRIRDASGRWHDLTTREFALAEMFLRHPDQVLSRDQLLRQVWELDFDPGSNVVDVYVGYLRRKLGSASLETVRGVGYRLRRTP